MDKRCELWKESSLESGHSKMIATVYAPEELFRMSGDFYLGGHLFAKAVSMSGDADLETMQVNETYEQALVLRTPEKKGATVAADPTFKLGEVYCYPNPAKGAKPVLHVETGLADAVRVRIYDVAGSLMREAELTQPAVIDGKYAYEYPWDTSGAGSGVYMFAVTAKKQGFPDLKAIRKCAVVK